MLPAAAAYYEKIHRIVLLASCIKQCEERPGKTGQAFPVVLPSQIRKGNFIAPIRAQTRQTRAAGCRTGPLLFKDAQWWNSRIPVNAITMPYLLAVSMTWSSRMEAAGLNDVLDAGFSRPAHIIAEGEKGVGAACDAGEGCESRFFSPPAVRGSGRTARSSARCPPRTSSYSSER